LKVKGGEDKREKATQDLIQGKKKTKQKRLAGSLKKGAKLGERGKKR